VPTIAISSEQQVRLARVLREVQLPNATPTPLAGDTNDTWRIGDVILRICWRGDRGRFTREAAVLKTLPPGVPHARVLDTGSLDDAGLPGWPGTSRSGRSEHGPALAWQVTRVLPGRPLVERLGGMSRAQRRRAVTQVGHALAALHAHRFPARVKASLAAPRPVGEPTTQALIGADIHPLPHQRALLLVEHARRAPQIDGGLLDDLAARLRELAPIDPLADGSPGVCVHGDAHPGNVLWHDGRVTALLDFEWARLGPPDLDLATYLRGNLGVPGLTEADRVDIFDWLAAAHPVAFQHPDLVRRLWLYQLTYSLRHLMIWPPSDDRQLAEHSMAVLRRIVASPVHLSQLLRRS